MIRIGRRLCGTFIVVSALCALGLVNGGCSSHQSSQQALDAQLKSLHTEKANLGKFAGRVTIDGSPPQVERGKKLIVILYDQANKDKSKSPIFSSCNADGSFAFYSYSANDGVPVGTYVVLFAELTASRSKGLTQPDGLKNLYNDPDKNMQDKDLVVSVTQPGRTDYSFNLDIAGKDPVTAPGPNAVTEFRKN
jgi:hypothetical protein